MSYQSQHEPFGVLPWIVALICLVGILVAVYTDSFLAQVSVLP